MKTLRRNDSSSDMADHILKVVGILEEGAQGCKSKQGLSKRSIRKKIAKWPSDYVFRLDDQGRMHADAKRCHGIGGPKFGIGRLRENFPGKH